MNTKTKVPKDYYIEMSNELAKSYQDAKNAPKRQLDRIKAVIESGKDYEEMKCGNVSLERLMEYYIKARKVDVDELKKKWLDFTTSHEIDHRMKGDILGAEREIDEFANIHVGYNDSENNYDLLHKTAHKYFLNEKQWDVLMEYMMSKGLVD